MSDGSERRLSPGVQAEVVGEIFNRARLTRMLLDAGHETGGDGDAELVARLYAELGVEVVHALDGEFALTVADGAAGAVFSARDRFGCVPHDGLPPAGRLLRRAGRDAEPETYWSLPARSDPGGESDAELVAELSRLLGAAVRDRLDDSRATVVVEDGGPASALLAALARREGRGPVELVSAGSRAENDAVTLAAGGVEQLFGSTEGVPVPDPSEARAPFLNFEVAEFAVTVPPRLRGEGSGSLLRLAAEAADGI